MVLDVKAIYDDLTRRAVELETVASVSASAASTLDLNKLLLAVSNLTRENFSLYHAHVYLMDESGESLVLTSGAGEAGRIIKVLGRRIAVNNLGSLVAGAARCAPGGIQKDSKVVAAYS